MEPWNKTITMLGLSNKWLQKTNDAVGPCEQVSEPACEGGVAALLPHRLTTCHMLDVRGNYTT